MQDTIVLQLLQPFLGLAGAPIVQQFVKFLNVEFKIPTYLSPVLALLCGIIFNCGAAAIMHTDMTEALVIGIFSGFGACGWHVLAKNTSSS